MECPMHTPVSFAEAERLLKSGIRLSPEQLASLLERNPNQPLSDVLRKYLVGVLRSRPLLPVGRRSVRLSAREDFLYADAIDLYREKLRQCRAEDAEELARARAKGDVLPKARIPAHERAAEAVIQAMKADFSDITPKRLLNRMSQIKLRYVPEEDELEPDDIPEELAANQQRKRG